MPTIAIAEQRPITITVCGDGEIELVQEYGGKTHAIYVWPENVIGLVDQIFLSAAGHDDLYLHRQRPGSRLCSDVPWPSDEEPDVPEHPPVETVAALVPPKPEPSRNALKQRAYRERKRAAERGNNPGNNPGNTEPDLFVDLLSRTKPRLAETETAADD
jgi:hypothetical protein